MELSYSDANGFYNVKEGGGKKREGRGRHDINDEEKNYKSKNLEAERKRRKKLNERLMDLRASVPIITNMNKATIIDDAINYIEGLQNQVKGCSEQLLQMEALSLSEKEEKPAVNEETDTAQEIHKYKIEEADVKVIPMDGNKLWIKILYEKKRGGFTKLMEAMSGLGFEVTDTNVTTSKGVVLNSFCVEASHVEMVDEAEGIREFLLEMIKGV